MKNQVQLEKLVALKNILCKMDLNEKKYLLQTAKYYQAIKNNGTDISNINIDVYNYLRKMEEKYSITIFLPGDDIATVIEEVMCQMNEVLNKAMEQFGQGTLVAKFQTIEEAQCWMQSQNNIIIKDIFVDANITGAYTGVLKTNNVRIEYVILNKHSNLIYGIQVFKKNRWYISSKIENVRRDWEESNPCFTWVKGVKFSNSRSTFGTHIGYVKKIKEFYVVLYSVNR